MDTTGLVLGDRVWRWWDAGCWMENQALTVVRVNRLTVTVRTDEGNTFRIHPEHLQGRVDWPEDDR